MERDETSTNGAEVTGAPRSDSRRGDVERRDRQGSIRFERLLDHPVERVWEALTTPEGLDDWWLPFPSTIEVDLVVGGVMSFSAPELGEAPRTCRIIEVDARKRLQHNHFDPAVTLTWELSDEGGACRLRLTQRSPDIADALERGQLFGLHHSLDRLEAALAGAPAPWDWDRLTEIEAEYGSG